MKLYWGPHTCAIGIHVLLEEVSASYETEKVDVEDGATHKPPFLAVNPKGKVPTLVRDDGSVLTEFSAIALWLALTHPLSRLWPAAPEGQARAMEVMAYVEGTIHGQGFGRIFKPDFYEPQDVVHKSVGLGQASVKKQGQSIAGTGFSILDPALSKHAFAAGEMFTIADAALFYVERWAAPYGVTLPVNVQAHFERMRERPSIKKVMKLWGEA